MPTSLQNQARISYSYDGAVSPEVANSNTTTTTLLDEYSLLADKSVLSNTYRPGENITYVIRLKNNGRGDLFNVTVIDNLGGTVAPDPLVYLLSSARLYVNGALTPLTPTIGAGRLTFTLPVPLEAGDTALILYIAAVRDDLAADYGQITNTATVSANGGSASGQQVTAGPVSATLLREAYADVSIIKSADKQVVSSGETLTYTFTLTNTGNQAATGVVLTDTLPAGFAITSVSVTSGGTTTVYPSTEYTVDPTTNTMTLPNTTGTQITVPAAVGGVPGVVTVTIVGTVTAP